MTGGAGFIGSNFIRWLLRNEGDVQVINLDALTYAGNLESLEDVLANHGPTADGRYTFVNGDVRDLELAKQVLRGDASPKTRAPDCIVHMAAESHVDRSIMGPALFVDTNVRGTLTLLEATRAELQTAARPFRFVQIGTDEVYGTLGADDPAFTETTPLAPNSPYSASKAGADLLVRSYTETFDFPAIITRCSNNYGPYQFPEKLIPLMITRALVDQPLPVYGDGQNIRDWLHVEDHASAIWSVVTRGEIGETYNIGGGAELPNITVVRSVLQCLGKPESLIRFVQDRAGHDRRYAMNTERICRELGWRPSYRFDAGIVKTVQWYLDHRGWWERVLNEAYRVTNSLYLNAEGGR
ncbi:MAG TPA: dTDP-glucose 4,6-dehydratase [Gemmatimonadaceae bacterium]|nr:dTDP-glucose 4,6-dehydratase [Gemmatimonadaceae bacterium]